MTELEYRQLLYNKYSMSKNPIQELKSYMEKRGKILPQSVIDALKKSFSVNSNDCKLLSIKWIWNFF